MRFVGILFLAFIGPSIVWAHGSPPIADSCQAVVGGGVRLSPRERLMKTILTANMHYPQASQGIILGGFLMTLNETSLLSELLKPTSLMEVEQAGRAMNRAHAAYGVAWRFGEGSGARQVTAERLAYGLDMARFAVLERFLILAERVEPGIKALTFPGLLDQQILDERGSEIVAAIQDFLSRHRLQDGGSRLGQYRMALNAMWSSTELREFGKRYREYIRQDTVPGLKFDPIRQNPFEIILTRELERLYGQQVARSGRADLDNLFFWSEGME